MARPPQASPVPPEVVVSLGSSKRPAVRVTIGGSTPAAARLRRWAGSSCSRSAPRTARAPVSPPVTRWTSLSNWTPRPARSPSRPTSPKRWIAMPTPGGSSMASPTASQRWHVLSIDGAKSPETRQRRIEKSVQHAAGGPAPRAEGSRSKEKGPTSSARACIRRSSRTSTACWTSATATSCTGRRAAIRAASRPWSFTAAPARGAPRGTAGCSTPPSIASCCSISGTAAAARRTRANPASTSRATPPPT